MFLTTTGTVTTEAPSRLDLFLETGLPTLLIGMLAVFAILGIIFVVLQIMRAVFTNNATKAKKVKTAEEPAVKAEEIPQASVAEETTPATDDCAIVAAIVAAISAYTGKAPEGFRVVSFTQRK